ncbi:MAG: NAD(P)H-binding protein [Paraglaciecola sp.]|jgi:uncharacterized protein YbjT (DUF2867 family)|nr:NAD(P)H-binding protein [Paraglaciecola sp.]NCT46894.1 NAD(P)H-binding protein [Paraglaciecola sp.]
MPATFDALVLGATGLVGQALINQLLGDERYGQVTCLLRRPLHARMFRGDTQKLQPIVVDFDRLDDYQGYFGASHIYVCLGTTIKQAGSRSAFRKVDYEYVHVAAQLARAQRAKSFVWISSVGADAKSSNFYLRVKGELESAIMGMSGLDHAAAVRPSLLLGQRPDHRPGEALAIRLAPYYSPFLRGRLAKYKPIAAENVAAQMIALQHF